MYRRHRLLRAARMLLLAAGVAVCLAPLYAQEPAAKALLVMGQVSILKDSYPVALFQGNTVAPKQIIVTGADGYAKFQTSDGSTFEVFQNARVTFRGDYPSWTDLVQVWLGRIRVMIDHSRGPNPNRVTTPTAVISVRGTIFDVVVEDQDDTTLVSVEEGAVMVRHALLPSEKLLHTGESLTIFRNQPIARVADKTPAIRAALNAVRQAVIEAMTQRGGAGPLPGGTGSSGGGTTTTTGGAQGDKGKNTGGTGTTAPGAPGAPSAPGPPAGGGGGD